MRTNDKQLTLITGASASIGREMAKVFAEAGHDLILVARSEAKLKALASELKTAHGVQCTSIASDLAVSGAPAKLFDRVIAKGLEVGILVNNAGVLHEGPFVDTSLADHMQLLHLNVVALTAMTHLFLEGMLERKSGRILNLGSMAAFEPIPRLASYAASKAYVVSMTEALTVELQGTGVTATAMCPGFTDTELIAKGEGGKKMSLPLIPNMSPEEVARDGYRVCMQGTPLYINGMGNQLAMEFLKVQPRWLKRAFSGMIR